MHPILSVVRTLVTHDKQKRSLPLGKLYLHYFIETLRPSKLSAKNTLPLEFWSHPSGPQKALAQTKQHLVWRTNSMFLSFPGPI